MCLVQDQWAPLLTTVGLSMLRGVLPGLAGEIIGALLHRGDGMLEEDDRALSVGGEACQQRATERELHSTLAVDPPDLDQPAVDRFGQPQEQTPDE